MNDSQKWENVLLTSAGVCDWDLKPKPALVERFAKMLGKPFADAKVLFMPTAAMSAPNLASGRCFAELLALGFAPNNIRVYDVDGKMTASEALAFDVMYFTGGRANYLLKRLRETGFDEIVTDFVRANKVYVGVSAGSLAAMPDLFELQNPPAGLNLVNLYFNVHCEPGTPARTDLPLPHISMTDEQAVAVSWAGYELIE
jgi:peptidase E